MATFGQDTPMDRPNPGGRAALFVPSTEADEAVASKLNNGSGMVGFGNSDGTVTVYFENNRFRDPGLHKWENKVFKSYGRMVERAPTVNKLTCPAGNLVQIGFIEGQEILVREMDALEQWLRKCDTLDSMPEAASIHAGR
jgi:propanediol dehydratase large subunit